MYSCCTLRDESALRAESSETPPAPAPTQCSRCTARPRARAAAAPLSTPCAHPSLCAGSGHEQSLDPRWRTQSIVDRDDVTTQAISGCLWFLYLFWEIACDYMAVSRQRGGCRSCSCSTWPRWLTTNATLDMQVLCTNGECSDYWVELPKSAQY